VIARGTIADAFFGVEATGAFYEWRQLATLIGFDAEAEELFAEGLPQLLRAPVPGLDLVRGEPAVGGKVIWTGGFWFALALTLPLIEVFVEAPDGLEADLIGGPGEAGAEKTAVESGENIGGGVLGVGQLVGGLEPRGTGKGEGGNLAGVEDFAGAVGVESLGEEALGDLGGDDLDGIEVFEQGDSNVRTFGADGEAIFGVGDAEVMAAEGAFAALEAADGERAAAVWGGSRLRVGEVRSTRASLRLALAQDRLWRAWHGVPGSGIRVRDGGWI
jgi:hypothetical protein